MMAKDGADKFIKDLEKLECKMLTKSIKDAQKDALKPLAQAIRQDAPHDTGELRKGIKIKAGNRKKGFIVTQVEIKTKDDNPHAGRVEFGVKDSPAVPFIRPNVKKLRDSIIEAFRNGIDKYLG